MAELNPILEKVMQGFLQNVGWLFMIFFVITCHDLLRFVLVMVDCEKTLNHVQPARSVTTKWPNANKAINWILNAFSIFMKYAMKIWWAGRISRSFEVVTAGFVMSLVLFLLWILTYNGAFRLSINIRASNLDSVYLFVVFCLVLFLGFWRAKLEQKEKNNLSVRFSGWVTNYIGLVLIIFSIILVGFDVSSRINSFTENLTVNGIISLTVAGVFAVYMLDTGLSLSKKLAELVQHQA